jgi:hypothetical protein
MPRDQSMLKRNMCLDLYLSSLQQAERERKAAVEYQPFSTSRHLIHLLKPTGYGIHHQSNIQQLYALPTLYLCVLYLSENKQRLVPLTA